MIPAHEVYTEVFFGGGTLFFAKQPSINETINDRLDIVINFYKVLKNDFELLKHRIDAMLISRTHHREALNIIKNHEKYSSIDKACAFWFVCNFSYSNKIGGGIKYSNDQSVVVPKVLKNKKDKFTELLVRRIENAQIENEDALKIIKSRNVDKAFHYLDPPYLGADMGHYKGYTENDFIDLLEVLQHIKGKFLLSNYDSDILRSYIRKNKWGYRVISNPLRRKSRANKSEILVYNYLPEPINLKLFEYD